MALIVAGVLLITFLDIIFILSFFPSFIPRERKSCIISSRLSLVSAGQDITDSCFGFVSFDLKPLGNFISIFPSKTSLKISRISSIVFLVLCSSKLHMRHFLCILTLHPLWFSVVVSLFNLRTKRLMVYSQKEWHRTPRMPPLHINGGFLMSFFLPRSHSKQFEILTEEPLLKLCSTFTFKTHTHFSGLFSS